MMNEWISNQFSSFSLATVKVMNAGKMGNRKDLSNFDKGQIIIARWLG